MVLSEIFPNGCSSKQRDALHEKFLNNKPLYEAWKDWDKETELIEEQLDALSMLDSCFAYGGVSDFHYGWSYNNGVSYYDKYLADYVKKGGSKEEFDKMLDIQKKHLARCSVKSNVYTDCEGCSYNSILDFDEEV